MDAINTTLKFTKQGLQRIFALIIMHLRLDPVFRSAQNGADAVIQAPAIDR
jgi:hypothetical protein